MEQDQFWALIQTLGSQPHDDDFERLTDELATHSPDDIIGFEDRLTGVLYALDTPAHAAAARARNDWFLYVRWAAVAAGRSTYEQCLTEPAKLRRFAKREAELLLPVASNAYERSTGLLWEYEGRVSYESGSNTTAWGQPEPSDRPEPSEWPEHAGPMPWLSLHSTVFLPDGWPAAYDHLVNHIGQAVIADPAWQTWWSAAGVPECHLSLQLWAGDGPGPTGTTVKVGRKRVEANSVQQPAPFTSTDPQELLPRAVNDVTGLLEVVRTHLGLSPLPPLNLPDLPADLPRGTERPETLAGTGASLLKAVAVGLLGRLRRRGSNP
jgi:hypothetical protein